jgi:hypothetical protein
MRGWCVSMMPASFVVVTQARCAMRRSNCRKTPSSVVVREQSTDHLGDTAMHTTSRAQAPSLTLTSGVTIPDSKMVREVTELVRDTESSLLFNHSSRVYYFAAATGTRRGLAFDLPASIFHLQLITTDVANWNAKAQVIAVFHTNAGHLTLNDDSYNAERMIATGNPYKALVADRRCAECKLSCMARRRQFTSGEIQICFQESRSTRMRWRECPSSLKKDS